ncbi:hypothetical protein AVEN_68439-1, partial [Araneus ventricosus]
HCSNCTKLNFVAQFMIKKYLRLDIQDCSTPKAVDNTSRSPRTWSLEGSPNRFELGGTGKWKRKEPPWQARCPAGADPSELAFSL